MINLRVRRGRWIAGLGLAFAVLPFLVVLILYLLELEPG